MHVGNINNGSTDDGYDSKQNNYCEFIAKVFSNLLI